VSLKM